MDKINRPPLQCTVIRREESANLPPTSQTPRAKNTLVIASDGFVPEAIQAHMDKVSKMRIFDDESIQTHQHSSLD